MDQKKKPKATIGRPVHNPGIDFAPLALKVLRTSRRMTGTDLAKKAKVSVSLISLWETGRSLPSEAQLMAICTALNCSKEDLEAIKIVGKAGTIVDTND